MPRGLQPNAPATDDGYSHHLTRPDNRQESEMQFAEDLQTDRAQSLRVDCQCNAYARETVSIPHVVIQDFLVDDSAGIAALMADPRITSTSTDNPEPHAPSSDFKPVHVHQAAATMRTLKLLPFSPFVSNLDALRSYDVYARWLETYEAQRPADDLAAESSFAPADHSEPVVASEPSVSSSDDGVALPAALAADVPPPVDIPDDVDLASLNRDATLKWIGDDPARAATVLELEMQRTTPRTSVVERAERLIAAG